MSQEHQTAPAGAVPCPFCALGCDDLSLSGHGGDARVDAAGCPTADAGFRLALDVSAAEPTAEGRPVSLAAAMDHAARRLAAARLPVIGGLAGDLADARGALRLAEAARGVVDHRNGAGLAAGMAVLQGSGWITTSLGDARNRADLMILVGDLTRRLPRLEERLLAPAHRLHSEHPPQVVVLDEEAGGGAGERIAVGAGGLVDFLQALRARVAGRPLLGAVHPEVERLAERLRGAAFPVIVFTAAALPGAHPDLVIRCLATLVRTLNAEGRAALLPLGGGDGDVTAQQVSAWHSGFGLRTSYHAGVPRHDARLWSAERVLADGEADLLVWVSPLNPEPPPAAAVPTLVFGHPATRFGEPPDLFVPVAVPGVHRGGVIHRGDGPALLPLRGLVDSPLPHCGEVLEGVRRLLEEARETA